MTRRQKQEIAARLIYAAGNLVEFYGEDHSPEIPGISAEEFASTLAAWLKTLPGDSWDKRLPEV